MDTMASANRQSKTLHLIRHGQSTFNYALRDHTDWANGFPDPLTFDAPLTEKGVLQAQSVRGKETSKGLADVEIVIVSPLRRALQTALHIFGDEIRSGKLRGLVTCMHREKLFASCDIGSHPEVLKKNFPEFDFEHLHDFWWMPNFYCRDEHTPKMKRHLESKFNSGELDASHHHHDDIHNHYWEYIQQHDKETENCVESRVNSFIDYLQTFPQSTIAIVGHGIFLKDFCTRVTGTWHDWLENCEVKTLELPPNMNQKEASSK